MATKETLFITEHLRSRCTTWCQRSMRWDRIPTTPEELVEAIYRFEPETIPSELAVFYQGSWIVWRTRTVALPDVLSEEAEALVDRLRGRLFCDEPDDDDFDRLECMIREMLVSRSAEELLGGGLSGAMGRVAVLDGPEPVARMTLTADDILEGAPG